MVIHQYLPSRRRLILLTFCCSLFFLFRVCQVQGQVSAPTVPGPEPSSNPSSDLSSDLGPHLTIRRYGMPAVLVSKKIFVLGGRGTLGLLGDVEQVDVITTVAHDISTNLMPRYFHTAQAIGPYIYLFGGETLPGIPHDTVIEHMMVTGAVERYDTRTREVQKMAPMPTPRKLAASAVKGNKIYLLGGTDQKGKQVATLEVYDSATNSWTTEAPMPTPRECAVFLHEDQLYATGGFDNRHSVKNFEVYDIPANRWSTLPPLPFPVSAHHMAGTEEYLFTFGDYYHPGRVGVYSFKTQMWHLLRGTGYQPSRHSAIVQTEQAVYIFGGNTAPGDPLLHSIQVLSFDKLVGLARQQLPAKSSRLPVNSSTPTPSTPITGGSGL